MFIAMNRFFVRPGKEKSFERLWAERESRLSETPGVIEFHLLRGPATEDHTLYASHTSWATRDAFAAWTRSDAFQAAHRNAGAHRDLYMGPPRFEGFDVVLEQRFVQREPEAGR